MKNYQKALVLLVILIIIVTVLYISEWTNGSPNNNIDLQPDPLQTVNTQINPNPVRPNITVIYPNGGENWKIGQTYTITVTTIGDLGKKTVLLNRYSDDGIRTGTQTIGNTETNTFSYTVPAGTAETRFEASRYKVQVGADKYDTGMGVADESDDYFSITSGTAISDWKTYENKEYGFIFKYPYSVDRVNTSGADLELEIQSVIPNFKISFIVNRASLGFSGFVNYKPQEEVESWGKKVIITYLKRNASTDDYLFVTSFEKDNRNYLITSRTNATDLNVKEATFKKFVQSIQQLVMP